MDDGGGCGTTEDVVHVAKSAKQQFFSFLSRRPKNQIEPNGGRRHGDEEAELPNSEDLFRCTSSSNHNNNNSLVNHPEQTTSLKKSILQPRGPFALCCTADGRAMTPVPVIVRYNNENNNNNNSTTSNTPSGRPRPPPRRSHSNFKDNLAYESESFERRFYSPPPPPPVAESTERPRSRKILVQPCDDETRDTLNDLKSCPNYSPSTFDKRPGYAEYYQQNTYNSIAMSACKSRLREKLLPPPSTMPEKVQQNGAEIYSLEGDGGPSSQNHVNNNISTNSGSPIPVQYDTERGGTGGSTSNYCQRPASTDSLARQALMAAQVLHLIPAERARARSIAQGTNVVCNNTLLGTSELNRILPNREVKIFVGTWNMNGEPPPR